MCAILGVSFTPDSTINRRKLAAALLSEGEVRGRDASGFAFTAPGGDGLYKKDVPGGKLHVGRIATDASALILHTRASTHGSPKDPDNNHPVVSPSGNIRLVHNGVVYNHNDIRELLGKVGKTLPDVDSSVIPAIIETYGLDATSELSGYASAAWFDTETDDTIHLARFKTSTVFFAPLYDGSLAFASTADILGKALHKAGIAWFGGYPAPFDSMSEGDYFQIAGGEILSESEVEWKSTYNWSGPDYSRQTSGGQSQASSQAAAYDIPESSVNRGHGFASGKPQGSEDQKALVIINHGLANEMDDEDDSREGAIISKLFSSPEAVDPQDMTDEEFEAYASGFAKVGELENPMVHAYDDNYDSEMFFSTGHDGDYVTFTTLSGLLAKLSWDSDLSGSENNLVGPEEGKLRWVNHIADIGSLDDEGVEVSWVKNEDDLTKYLPVLPTYVREGVTRLRSLVGA